MERVIGIILGVILVGLIIGSIIFGANYDSNFIYKCTDTKGNIIYCIDAYISRGGMFGTMEDGTKVTITSYKLVEREEKQYDN